MLKELKAIALQMRKDKNPLAPTVVFHLAEIEKVAKNDGNRAPTDKDALVYLKKEVKKLKDQEHANPDELAILEGLLPQMASEQEVRDFLSANTIANKGMAMGLLKKNFGDLVDMGAAGRIVDEMLAQ
mgnify:CR=1 FL=1